LWFDTTKKAATVAVRSKLLTEIARLKSLHSKMGHCQISKGATRDQKALATQPLAPTTTAADQRVICG
jgi:hypothetical protein